MHCAHACQALAELRRHSATVPPNAHPLAVAPLPPPPPPRSQDVGTRSAHGRANGWPKVWPTSSQGRPEDGPRSGHCRPKVGPSPMFRPQPTVDPMSPQSMHTVGLKSALGRPKASPKVGPKVCPTSVQGLPKLCPRIDQNRPNVCPSLKVRPLGSKVGPWLIDR